MLLLILAAAPAALQAPAAICPRTTSHHAIRSGESVRPRKLNQLPDANAYAAVYRRVGGCEVPAVVHYGVSNRR